MPNRIIKESIRTSKSINKLSDFNFRFWAYLITYVDDYGRGSADPELLKGFVFPRRKSVTEATIQKGLTDLANAGLIHLYEVGGESYLYFPTWSQHQRIQQKRSKFPEPIEEEKDEIQEDTHCHRNSPYVTVTHGELPPESESESKSEVESESERRARARDTRPAIEDLIDRFGEVLAPAVDDWLSYKQERREAYKPTGLKSFLSRVEREAQEHGDQAVADVIQLAMSNGWRGIVWEKLTQKDGRRNEQNAGCSSKQGEFNPFEGEEIL